MLKVHYYSDCPFFAGCENMLANFFNSENFRQSHIISFSYRQSASYTQGFKQRVKSNLPVYPLTFPDLSDSTIIPDRLSFLSKRLIMAFVRLIFNAPVLMYEIVVLFFLFKKIKPDILHINNGGYPAALSARAAAIAGKLANVPKVIMVVNNIAVGYKNFSRWLDYPIDFLVVHSVDQFVTGSQAAASRLRYVLNLHNHKVLAIHNGVALRNSSAVAQVTLERFGLSNFDGVIFGVVALLVERKGHQVLLDAILKLVLEGRLKENSLKILIEGNGPLGQTLADLVNNHNLTRWVTFVGDEANIVDFMSVLDVLILPSVEDEDFPNVILESMALAKPVIASRLAGTSEQVADGVTGVLVEPRNVEQLAEAISFFMDNENQLSGMGRAGLNRFKDHFTYQAALANYSTMYIKLFETQK